MGTSRRSCQPVRRDGLAAAFAHAVKQIPARRWLGLTVAGVADQVTALAARAAADTPLGNPQGIAQLLKALRAAGAADQAEVLAERLVSESC